LRQRFTVDADTAIQLTGWKKGSGPPVLVLHGGPGLSFDYLEGLIADIGDGFEIATYQQRGLAPSTTNLPVEVAQEVDDVRRVLDDLGWSQAWVVGHSWGGHLLLHFALAHPDRLFGGLAVDPLGGVGDGGLAAFQVEMRNRGSDEVRAQLDRLEQDAAAEPEDPDGTMREFLMLMWPSYFAKPVEAPRMPNIALSARSYSILLASVVTELPHLEASLGTITVPIGFLSGGDSPLPVDVATKMTAEKITGSWVEVVDGAGHFPWHESPGCVLHALKRLVDH
jgi:pimeloyl-ACP methyl ester carboxylesterase